jgi:polyisoprenoid-binding protein YceI
MKSLIIVPAFFLAFAATRPAAAPPLTAAKAWTIDPVHSSVVFRVKHANAAWFYGTFNHVTGTFALDADKPEDAKVDVTIAADSIETHDAARNKHVRGPDFLDAKQYPDIKFTGDKVTSKGKDEFEVEGQLEIRGKKQTLKATVQKVGEGSFMGGQRVGYETTFEIKRSDFGMNYGIAQKALGDQVQVTISVEGKQG